MTYGPVITEARRAAELAARTSYGRLIASLASRSRDIVVAEDALSDAFAAALATWPERGVPSSPEAWLLTAARRNLNHRARHENVQLGAVAELLSRIDEGAEVTDWAAVDERLKLLFVCAHPAIDENIRTPLMLQTVLGLDAQRIGSAFLVAPSTMGQRLVRAKTKIKQAALRFEVPDLREAPTRLDDVLRAVYVAYGSAWDDHAGGRGLAEEALCLGRTLVSLLPQEPEARGLLALMLYCESRREARRDESGWFVPLPEQDPRRWSTAMIIEAEALLTAASQAGRFGRFQCEAAIQSVHAQRGVTGHTEHAAICLLYELLLNHTPSVGVAVGRAAALIEAGALEDGARALDALDPESVLLYQPYWVVRARLAERRGDQELMRCTLERALGLTEDAAVRRYLSDRLV